MSLMILKKIVLIAYCLVGGYALLTVVQLIMSRPSWPFRLRDTGCRTRLGCWIARCSIVFFGISILVGVFGLIFGGASVLWLFGGAAGLFVTPWIACAEVKPEFRAHAGVP